MAFDVCKLSRLQLGKQGENKATVINIDVADWLERWPEAAIQLVHVRHDEDTPYEVTNTVVTGRYLTWTVTSTDTAIAGKGIAEIRAIDGDVLKKSRIIETIVEPAVEGTTGETPDALADWAAKLATAVQEAQSALDEVQNALEAVSGWDTATATAVSLESGEQPTVDMIRGENGVELAFGIPKGDPGPKGDKGDKGDPGSGSVSTVNLVQPDENGNVQLTADEIGALPSKISGVTEPMLIITDAEGNVVASKTFNGDLTINGTLTATKVVGAVYA